MTQKSSSYKRGNRSALKISSGHQAQPKGDPDSHTPTGDNLAASIPEPPKTLRLKGQRLIWQAVCQALLERDQLTDVDLTVVEAYAWSVHEYYRLRQQAEKTDPFYENAVGNLVEHPIRKLVQQQLNNTLALARQLGMTPRARQDMAAAVEKVKGLRMANATDVESEHFEHIGGF